MAKSWIILDRDGVINQDSDAYIKSAAEWQPLPGSIEAIVNLKKAGYHVAVASNQSGLARGLFDLDDLEAMHAKLQTLVAEQGACIDAIFYCPHAPEDNCNCRKPRTGLLDALETEFDADLSASWLVGDQLKDLQLALQKNCNPVLVLTGKGKEARKQLVTEKDLQHSLVYPNLHDFVDALLKGRLA